MVRACLRRLDRGDGGGGGASDRGAAAVARDSGAVVVEFALLFPVIMVVIFGIIGFGTVFTQMQSLSNASRDAARAGVVTYPTPIYCSDLITKARTDADTIGINSSMLTVTVWSNYAETGGVESGTVLCQQINTQTVTGTKTGTSATSKPCNGATDSGGTAQLTVVTEYTTNIELLFTSLNPTIKGRGTFRCEYTT